MGRRIAIIDVYDLHDSGEPKRMNEHETGQFEAVRDGAALIENGATVGQVTGILARDGMRSDFVVAPIDGGEEWLVPVELCDPVRSTADQLWLRSPESGDAHTADASQTFTVPLAEERLIARIREVNRGTVRIHKRVETQPVEDVVHLRRDNVEIEHREMNQPVEEVRAPWYEGETLVLPVYEEIPVVTKRLILREEVRITKQSHMDDVEIDDTVQREVVEVERVQDDGSISS
jgi:uncharacterized protein (TIGR02271 family)